MTIQEKIRESERKLKFAQESFREFQDLAINEQIILKSLKILLKAEQEVYDPNWRPEEGVRYWYIDSNGRIFSTIYHKSDFNGIYKFLSNNVYKAEAQADKGKQAVELMAEIRNEWEFTSNLMLSSWIIEVARGDALVPVIKETSSFYEQFGDRIKQLKDYL